MTAKLIIEDSSPEALIADIEHMADLIRQGGTAPIPTPVPTPTPTPTPTPAPSTAYVVLTMPAGVTAGDPTASPQVAPGALVVGTGAHELSFRAGTAYGTEVWTNPPATPIEFSVYLTDENGRHKIADTLHVTGWGWQSDGKLQSVTIKGDWGNTPTKVEIVTAGAGWPDYTTWRDFYYDGNALLFGGTIPYWGGGSGSANQPIVWTSTPSTTPAPVPVQVAGDGSLAKAIAVGVLPAQTFKDSTAIATDVAGSGMGKTIIDATGITLAHGKGALVPTAHCKVSQLSIVGAATALGAGGNGAGVRDDGPGIGFDLDTVEISKCQDGVLTFDGNYSLTNCNLHDNGAGDGQTHNAYFGGSPSSVVTVTGTQSINPIGGHALKSRAGTTVSSGNILSAMDGSCIDVPDGGALTIINDHWSKPAGSADHNLLTYGLESTQNGIGTITINGLVVDNPDGNALIQVAPGTTINLSNATYTGPSAPTIIGATANGQFTKGA